MGSDVNKTLSLVESKEKLLYVIVIPWLEANIEVGAKEVKPAKESKLTTEGITFWTLVIKNVLHDVEGTQDSLWLISK